MSTATIPFEEMCHHARDSCMVNGLQPSHWRWGRDAVLSFQLHMMMSTFVKTCDPPQNYPKGAIMIYEGLPVFRMRASGVACIGRSPWSGNFSQQKF